MRRRTYAPQRHLGDVLLCPPGRSAGERTGVLQGDTEGVEEVFVISAFIQNLNPMKSDECGNEMLLLSAGSPPSVNSKLQGNSKGMKLSAV